MTVRVTFIILTQCPFIWQKLVKSLILTQSPSENNTTLMNLKLCFQK